MARTVAAGRENAMGRCKKNQIQGRHFQGVLLLWDSFAFGSGLRAPYEQLQVPPRDGLREGWSGSTLWAEGSEQAAWSQHGTERCFSQIQVSCRYCTGQVSPGVSSAAVEEAHNLNIGY